MFVMKTRQPDRPIEQKAWEEEEGGDPRQGHPGMIPTTPDAPCTSLDVAFLSSNQQLLESEVAVKCLPGFHY